MRHLLCWALSGTQEQRDGQVDRSVGEQMDRKLDIFVVDEWTGWGGKGGQMPRRRNGG